MRLLIDFGYRGEIYPVNPRRSEIFGKRCYPSIAELPSVPDHVGIILPAASASGTLLECGRTGVPFATVFSSGFAETGTGEGQALQRELVTAARAAGTRVMGPNCNGLINFVEAFALTSTATIMGPRRPPGDIAVASQSGGAGQVNVMWRAQQAGLDINFQVSCGNDADLDLLDYAAFMLEQPSTRVLLVLAERIGDGAKLTALAERALTLDKPIVMIKAGRTEAGARAAASHTGALTGADAVCDAALHQLGIIRVDDAAELYETAMLLRGGRRPRGRRAAAVSISGGNLVLAADLGASVGIEWPAYGESTQQRLRDLLPGFSAASNPTDLTAASIGKEDAFAAVTQALVEDPNIDALVPVLTFSPAAEIRSVAGVCAKSEKPIAMLWTGRCIDDPGLTPATLVAGGHAVYRDTFSCLKALRRAMSYGEFRALHRTGGTGERPRDIDRSGADRLLANARGTLTERESKALLACYGLPVTREVLARDADEAAALARHIGGAVALKISSPDLPHKTEAGGIRLDLCGDDAIRRAFDEIVAAGHAYKPQARIEGVLVQEMVREGHEVLLGISRDATFGPVLTFGLGGIYVEVLRDVAFRLPPISAAEARAALAELRSYPLLAGVRGRAPSDIDALVDCLVRVSWLALDLPPGTELDINPLRVLPQGGGAKVVDALFVAAPGGGAAA